MSLRVFSPDRSKKSLPRHANLLGSIISPGSHANDVSGLSASEGGGMKSLKLYHKELIGTLKSLSGKMPPLSDSTSANVIKGMTSAIDLQHINNEVSNNALLDQKLKSNKTVNDEILDDSQQ